MLLEPVESLAPFAADAALEVYLLGSVGFEAALALQKRLVYEVAGDRSRAALVVCEHPPTITVGREGSWAHIRFDPAELRARRWPICWLNRGGGCLLHLPGQLVAYPVLPLDRLGLGVQAYIDRLQLAAADVLADFSVAGQVHRGHPGVWAGGRLLAGVGVAIRHWVSYHGLYFNIAPDLEPFRRLRTSRLADLPMTSLARERRGSPNPALVRQRFLEYFAARFAFTRTSLFFDHPSLCKKAPSDAVAASY